jgi:catechol-2,3-dioxygenase
MRTLGLAEIVLMVGDIARSRQFYEGTLGLRVISPDLGGPVFLQTGEEREGVPQQIVLVPRPQGSPLPPADRTQRGFHHLGLVVARGGLREARRELESLGYEVRTGEHPFLPVEAIYVDEPDGNEVELVERK